MKTLPPGTAIGPYVLEGEVARGGMGAVYRARRALDGAVVALKVLHTTAGTTPEQRERFRREAQLAAALVHPGIVRVHDAGEAGPLCYIAMDLIEGESLAARAGRVAPLEAAACMAQVARAIEHAHAHGVIHRDLKPSNVLLRRDDGRALVTDFGVARHVESAALTKTGAMVGTPTYLSPEQAGGLQATPASDVHALGAVLYELLTGLPPFRRDELHSLLIAITSERPEPPSALTLDVPRALDRVCLAALAKSPAARPGAGELAAELEAIVDGRASVRRGGWALPALAAVVGLVALVLVGLAVRKSTGSSAGVADPTSATTTTTTDESRPVQPATPTAVGWTEPGWLRDLAANGDASSLVAAHAALDANERLAPPVEVDERTRARTIEVLTELDRRWTPPAATDPDRTLAGDRLAWIHWLWKRVDPRYVFPTDRELLLEANIVDVAAKKRQSGDENDAYLARAGRAAMALQPRQISGYMLYASGLKDAPGTPRAVPYLRVGLALAEEQPLAWSYLARMQVRQLDLLVDRDPASAGAAREELLALARSAMLRVELKPVDLLHLLVVASDHAPPDEAAAFIDKAAAQGKPECRPMLARARLLRRLGRLEEAAEEAERAGNQAVREADGTAVTAFTLAADVFLVQGHRSRALTELGLALEHGPRRHPGVALRWVVALIDEGMTAALGPELDKLADRLAEHVDRLRLFPEAQRVDLARLEAALADVRAAASEPMAIERDRGRLSRWATPEGLALLDR